MTSTRVSMSTVSSCGFMDHQTVQKLSTASLSSPRSEPMRQCRMRISTKSKIRKNSQRSTHTVSCQEINPSSRRILLVSSVGQSGRSSRTARDTSSSLKCPSICWSAIMNVTRMRSNSSFSRPCDSAKSACWRRRRRRSREVTNFTRRRNSSSSSSPLSLRSYSSMRLMMKRSSWASWALTPQSSRHLRPSVLLRPLVASPSQQWNTATTR
mmetsp:Transcript_69091/g.164615  ORF Transcript_69091/g.164615 Transcript_69091/m.164615 type:complete len:211 (-) Transcript_69091:614-1246(-)